MLNRWQPAVAILVVISALVLGLYFFYYLPNRASTPGSSPEPTVPGPLEKRRLPPPLRHGPYHPYGGHRPRGWQVAAGGQVAVFESWRNRTVALGLRPSPSSPYSQTEGLGSSRAPDLLVAPIHRSAWKAYSPKLALLAPEDVPCFGCYSSPCAIGVAREKKGALLSALGALH
jgi:hypothetical protein